jgi:hypothetical protein
MEQLSKKHFVTTHVYLLQFSVFLYNYLNNLRYYIFIQILNISFSKKCCKIQILRNIIIRKVQNKRL